MKNFIFNLKTKSNMAKPLLNEINGILGVNGMKILSENKTEVKAEMSNISMLSILEKSRLIDNIQVEICSKLESK